MSRVWVRMLSCALFATFALGGCNGGTESGDSPALQAQHRGGKGTGNGNNPAANLPAAEQPACAIRVPANPLSAEGLATPYELLSPCQEANINLGVFVQAVILDPNSGSLSVYNPLVINEGDQPLVKPTTPTLPANAVVGLWFGFNGTTLVPVADNSSTLSDANCVFGLGDSLFGQVGACNAADFFAAAETAMANGLITPPPLGTAKDGQACPTTRDFSVVDQDPSDNVTTSYLASNDGRIAQNTPENVAALKAKHTQFTVLNNGSDNALLSLHIDPAIGCTPWQASDITSQSGNVVMPAQALNELHASAWHNPNNVDANTIALVEAGDEMVLVKGNQNQTKLDLYRANVDQPANILAGDANWCRGLAEIGAPRINEDQQFTKHAATIDPAMGTNLFTFLVARLQATMAKGGNGLDCAKFGVKFPFEVTMDGNGVVTNATFNPNP